jgi:hypothetical protein
MISPMRETKRFQHLSSCSVLEIASEGISFQGQIPFLGFSKDLAALNPRKSYRGEPWVSPAFAPLKGGD